MPCGPGREWPVIKNAPRFGGAILYEGAPKGWDLTLPCSTCHRVLDRGAQWRSEKKWRVNHTASDRSRPSTQLFIHKLPRQSASPQLATHHASDRRASAALSAVQVAARQSIVTSSPAGERVLFVEANSTSTAKRGGAEGPTARTDDPTSQLPS